MTIDDTDERTCHHLMRAFLKDKGLGDVKVALLDGFTVVLRCVKMCDARLHGGRLASGRRHYSRLQCVLVVSVILAIAEVQCRRRNSRSTSPVM